MAVITGPLSRAFDAMKGVMTGDHHVALQDALREVERLRDELAALVRTTETADQEADRLALANPHNIDQIAPMLAATRRGWIASPADRALDQLFKQNPDWRETLKSVCEGKLLMIEAQSREIEKSVRQELSDGFDEDQIQSHPGLKRIRREAGKWRELMASCDSTKDTELWKRVTRNL
jgi:hypothetical protein